MNQGHSLSKIYLHIVWATYNREPMLTPTVERMVYRCIQQQAHRLNCTVLAMGGTADHVHLAVHTPTSVSAAQLMQRVKGISSKLASDEGADFAWHPGFSAFSLSRTHLGHAKYYLKNQKRHHAEANLWPEWEQIAPE
ncbi:MAG: IS200/IS605 family transposase [Armatimonadetes bacterium]|nr:IS200/IS605 family transposase [Armatimonadota bacterium]